jgi:DivIVA domain-containing protein
MPEDRPRTIASTPGITPEEILRQSFPTVRRGLDPASVRALLDSVARELASALAREERLREDLAAAQDLAANPVLDEDSLTRALGQETAKVLRSAHDAANELLARRQEEARVLLEEAEQFVATSRAEAEEAAAELRRRTDAEVEELRDLAQREAESLLAKTRDECREIVQEAQALRTRVLGDLNRRRRALHAQIEQLRAGRERLAETITGVGRSVQEISDELFQAEDAARLAAEAAGRQSAFGDEEGFESEELPSELVSPVPAVSEESPVPAPSGEEAEDAPFDIAAEEEPPTASAASSASNGMASVRPLSSSAPRPRIAARFDDENGGEPQVEAQVVVRPPSRSPVVVSAPTAAEAAVRNESARNETAVRNEAVRNETARSEAARHTDTVPEPEGTSAPKGPAPHVEIPAVKAPGAKQPGVEKPAGEKPGGEKRGREKSGDTPTATGGDIQGSDIRGGDSRTGSIPSVEHAESPGSPRGVAESEEVPKQKAQEVFARLRASTPESAPSAVATQDLESGSKPESTASNTEWDTHPETPVTPHDTKSTAASAPKGTAASGAESAVVSDGEESTGAKPAEESDTASGEDAPWSDASAAGSGRDPLLDERDALIAPITAAVARRIKRALQDDQNDILDRLRSTGKWDPSVVPPVEEHEQRYSGAVLEQFVEAAQAGAVFVGGRPLDASGEVVVAGELAAAITGPLRRRIIEGAATLDSDDDVALVEHVGGAFREWKADRIGRLAGDFVVAAFSRSAVAAAAPGAAYRWVVDDQGDDCPDCDDNALAGPTPPGQQFPTGHTFPPAHAGCRCLLAPERA